MDNIGEVSFSPQQAGRLAIDMVESLRNKVAGGLTRGIPKIDEIVTPDRSGELITILGRPGMGKSQWLNWLSKQAVKDIEPESNEILIRATWEQSVEEDTLVWLAGDTNISVTQLVRGEVDDNEFRILKLSAAKRALAPMWIIGHSNMENQQRRRVRPRMGMIDIANAIEYICNDATPTKWKPKAIYLDYLQRIRPDTHGDRREQMMEIVDTSKDLAVSMGCPVYLGVQAGRQVDERSEPIPDMGDGQETSNIEQSSDKMWGLWYPLKTNEENSRVHGYKVTKHLFFAKLLKQKLGEFPALFPLFIDPAHNKFSEIVQETGEAAAHWSA
jgi:replicative DNA helicase